MADAFGFDAPQFGHLPTLHHTLDEQVESYFDCDHESLRKHEETVESESSVSVIEISSDDLAGENGEVEFYTPMVTKSDTTDAFNNLESEELQRNKSKSLSHLALAEASEEEIRNETPESENPVNDQSTVRAEDVHPRQFVGRSNSSSRLHEKKMAELSKPKTIVTRFVSMTEAINQFQRGTPKRFHTKPKNAIAPSATGRIQGPLAATIPQSPALATRLRSRPATVESAKDREVKELEEMKKLKFKAKPATNLGAISKLPRVLPKECTVPVTPEVLKRARSAPRPTQQTEVRTSDYKPGRTQMKPFSFEARTKQMLLHKEEVVKNYVKAEKKAREFHAKPVPKSVYQPKAMPPKINRPLMEVNEFDLSSERRLRERRDYDEAIKRKLQRKEEDAKKIMEHIREQEELCKAAERKLLIHKAQPIRKYKELPPVSPKMVTVPDTPKFMRAHKSHNKENISTQM